MNIGIIGLGVVGKAVYDGFKYLGHNVSHYDINDNSSITDVIDSELVYICVPTPQSYDGSCDTSIVEETIYKLNSLNYKGVVCVKSTISPGTTRRLINEFEKLTIAHVPEFLRERYAYDDFIKNHNILVVGTDSEEAADIIIHSHKHLPKNVSICEPEEAELVKYFSNTYKAMKITFANSFKRVTDFQNVSYDNVLSMFLKHGVSESDYLKMSDNYSGFGGACLPKDVSALNNFIIDNNLDIELFSILISENKKFI